MLTIAVELVYTLKVEQQTTKRAMLGLSLRNKLRKEITRQAINVTVIAHTVTQL